jgi:hypothetical protein
MKFKINNRHPVFMIFITSFLLIVETLGIIVLSGFSEEGSLRSESEITVGVFSGLLLIITAYIDLRLLLNYLQSPERKIWKGYNLLLTKHDVIDLELRRQINTYQERLPPPYIDGSSNIVKEPESEYHKRSHLEWLERMLRENDRDLYHNLEKFLGEQYILSGRSD